MNDAHLHLLINHVPILGSLVGLILLSYGALRKQPDVVRVGLLSLIVVAVGSFAAVQTGEDAEEIVEELGISERVIHEHEEAAELANYAAIALGLLALGVFVWRSKEPTVGTVPTLGMIVASALVFGLMARAGNLGGEIRHTEIRDEAPSDSRSMDAPPASDEPSDDDRSPGVGTRP